MVARHTKRQPTDENISGNFKVDFLTLCHRPQSKFFDDKIANLECGQVMIIIY